MKKIITILLIIMFFSSASFAETVDESFYIGTWVSFQYLRTQGCTITLFHLDEDHTCYFLLRSFSNADDGNGRENVKTWSANGNNLSIVTGNTTWDLFVTSDYKLAKKIPGGYEVYERVGGLSSGSSESNGGIKVPSGVYVAGEDFPAGTYRVELADPDNGGVFLLYDSISDVNTAFAYLYEYRISKYDSPVVGKIEIKAGNALAVRNTVIVLLPYEGLQ